MNPKQKLEQAAQNYLTELETPLTLIAEASIYKGVENPISVESDENTEEAAQREHPSVMVEAEGEHEEAIFGTRIFQGQLAVSVEWDGNVLTDTEADAICSEVFGKFNIVEIEANFSTRTDNFTMIQARINGVGDAVSNGQNLQKTLRLDCVYALADI